MNDLIKQALLFDYYGELLTDQQKKIYRQVYFEDYSASEVADGEGISRQGVHDMLKRTQKLLDEYEENLSLVAKHLARKELIESLEDRLDGLASGDKSFLPEIKKICEELKND